ncbi:MAG: hypothetical protein MK066_13325 [Crocinitomicaceae bacterium]|nr:hypothetical protein [Crocinitomicaceae bacterium]
MLLQEIIIAMQKWEDIRSDASKLTQKFNQGNGFVVPTDLEVKGSYIHAYPGINNGELTFFLINAEDDVKANQSNLASYITVCPVSQISIDLSPTDDRSGTDISKTEAIRRVRNWRDSSDDWLQAHIGNGIFQALLVPMGDYVANNVHSTFFALAGNSRNYSADLITRDEKIGTVSLTSFHDMVRPVPPFGGTSTPSSQGSFYLLSLV